jgi:hypothetical protein
MACPSALNFESNSAVPYSRITEIDSCKLPGFRHIDLAALDQ